MPFFGNRTLGKGPNDQKAKQLYEALAKKRKIYNKPNLVSWSNEFRELAKVADPAEVQATLDWYCAHFGDEFVPQAYAASSFRKRYKAIRSAMHRSQKKTNLLQGVRVGPRAIMVQEEWCFLWPNQDETDQELLFLQASLDRYHAWIAELAKVQNEPVRGLRDYLVEWFTPNDVNNIGLWLQYVHGLAWNWNKWPRQGLAGWVWTPRHKWWTPKVLETVGYWAGEDRAVEVWNDYLAEMKPI